MTIELTVMASVDVVASVVKNDMCFDLCWSHCILNSIQGSGSGFKFDALNIYQN